MNRFRSGYARATLCFCVAGALVILVVTAGCASESKRVDQPTAQGQRAAGPAAGGGEASTSAGKAAPLAARKADERGAKSDAGKDADVKLDDLGLNEGRPMTDSDRDALAERIRAAAESAQRQRGEQAAPARPAPPPAPKPAEADAGPKPKKPADQAMTAQKAAGEGAAEAKSHGDEKGGCGAAGDPNFNLNPPPQDQPQPKYVCKEPKQTIKPLWSGQPAAFTFTVANEGEAPLAIRLKKG